MSGTWNFGNASSAYRRTRVVTQFPRRRSQVNSAYLYMRRTNGSDVPPNRNWFGGRIYRREETRSSSGRQKQATHFCPIPPPIQLYAPKDEPVGNRGGQDKVLPRSAKTRKKRRKIDLRTYTPPPQQQRIKRKYMDGMSIRQIAREEHKARETVTKIVHSADMSEIVQRMREKLFALMDECIDAITRAVKYSKDGGWLAFELAERWGAIPPKPRAI